MDNTEIEYMGYRTKNFSQFPEIRTIFKNTLSKIPITLNSKIDDAENDVVYKPDLIKKQQNYRNFIE